MKALRILPLLALLLAVTLPASAQNGRYVDFSFDQVDVETFVRAVGGEIEGQRFVVDNSVAGRTITVVSPRIPVDEVFPVFVSILDASGCALDQQDEGTYRVTALQERITPAAPVVGVNEPLPEQGMVTKVMRLSYVSASEMVRVLEPRVAGGRDGAIRAVETTDHLVITDSAESIRRIVRIIEEVDQPGLSRTIEVVALQYADAEDIASQLSRALAEQQEGLLRGGIPVQTRPVAGGVSTARTRAARIVAVPHSNSLLVSGSAAQLHEVMEIIAQLDVDSPSGRGRLRAIPLHYIRATEAAESLAPLLVAEPGASGRGTIRIQAYEANNAILVDAMPYDFEQISELIAELDTPRQQIEISILIVEVSERDALDIGVDFAGIQLPSEVGETTIQGGSTISDGQNSLMVGLQQMIFPSGMSVALAHGVREDPSGNLIVGSPAVVNIEAIRQDSRFEIVQDFCVEGQENEEILTDVVENRPILTSVVQDGAGGLGVIQNIERLDVGTRLRVVPRVNPRGEILMELNPSIEAVIGLGPLEDDLAPIIARRELSTTVTVPDGETAILSGLIREDVRETVRRVPILGSIPLIGWIFRRTTQDAEKTNLLIFVTPRIVREPGSSEAVAEAYERMPLLEQRAGRGHADSGEEDQDVAGDQ